MFHQLFWDMILLENLMAIVVDKMRTVAPLQPTADDEAEQPPHYLEAHPMATNARLIDRTHTAPEKYPLVYLMLDYSWQVHSGMTHFNVNVVLLEASDQSYTSEQRTEIVYRPKLLPLYQRFLKCIPKAGFSWQGALDQPPHEGV